MAYPASTRTLQDWVESVDQRATTLKSEAQNQFNAAAAGTLNIDTVRRFYDFLKSTHVFFTTVSGVTGIGPFVTTQKQNAVADPVAEFTAMLNAVKATIDWLHTNLPTGTFSATTYVLGWRTVVDYTSPAITLTFTAGQTATYRTALTALIATIG